VTEGMNASSNACDFVEGHDKDRGSPKKRIPRPGSAGSRGGPPALELWDMIMITYVAGG
jgi:hypothetical protein